MRQAIGKHQACIHLSTLAIYAVIIIHAHPFQITPDTYIRDRTEDARIHVHPF